MKQFCSLFLNANAGDYSQVIIRNKHIPYSSKGLIQHAVRNW